jgi:hypothetical protein
MEFRHAVVLPPSEWHGDGLEFEWGKWQVIGRKWVTWVNLLVNDKGFISFAAERAGGKKSNPEAAKVMKPCSELNLGASAGL